MKRIILIVGFGLFLYITLIVISPFLINFGPTPIFNKIINIFYTIPFSSTKYIFIELLINSIFWSLIFNFVFVCIKNLVQHLKNIYH